MVGRPAGDRSVLFKRGGSDVAECLMYPRAFDPGRSEDPALTLARIQEQVVSHVAELAAEPGSQRDPESHRPARENVKRKTGGHGAFEYVFARSLLHFERARECGLGPVRVRTNG